MEKCIRCGIDGRELRLFDAICDGRMEQVCERCSIIENIPIIKKPGAEQLKDAEKENVLKRMRRLSGVGGVEEEKTFFIEDKLKELDKKPELELPEKEKLNLIEHYYWEIMKHRRRKGFSQKKLAEALGESEAAIQMIEKAKLPENAEILVKKIEQFFQIKLKEVSEMEKITGRKREEQKTVLLDRQGKELEVIPEPEVSKTEISGTELELIPGLEIKELGVGGREEAEVHCKVEVKKDSETPLLDDEAVVECRVERSSTAEDVKEEERDLRGVDMEKGELDFREADLNKVTIADLKDLHKRKIEATKQEKIEEQGRIEERQRLIEARKEELRMRKEKEFNDLSSVLGGKELLEDLDKDDSFEERDEFDEERV